MFIRLILSICLFGYISNLTIKDNSFQNNDIIDDLVLSLNTNVSFKEEPTSIKWYHTLFISIVILILFIIYLYYYRISFHFILNLCLKSKNNNENVTRLNQTPLLKCGKSMYLTVPQPSYLHR
jgi:hypothetical protein